MSPPPDLEHLSPTELKDLVLKLLAEVAELRRTVAAQRDEIAPAQGRTGPAAYQAEWHGAGERSEAAGQPAQAATGQHEIEAVD